MKLIADSGSTKTHWRLLDRNHIQQLETIGLNPHFIDEELLKKTLSELSFSVEEIKEVYFYGAGCGMVEQANWMQQELSKFFTNSQVLVYSDLLAAARALCGNNEGLVGVLGTGSNLAYYNGKELTFRTPSLGYVLGDEGSGNYLGRLFLRAYLRGEFSDEINQKIKLTKSEVLENIYKKDMPNKYLASMVPFIFRNRKHPEMAMLIQQNFTDWLQQYVLKHPESKQLSVVGSIAFYFSVELEFVAKSHGIELVNVLESPIAALALYHLEE